jgi:hypothetical protein
MIHGCAMTANFGSIDALFVSTMLLMRAYGDVRMAPVVSTTINLVCVTFRRVLVVAVMVIIVVMKEIMHCYVLAIDSAAMANQNVLKHPR